MHHVHNVHAKIPAIWAEDTGVNITRLQPANCSVFFKSRLLRLTVWKSGDLLAMCEEATVVCSAPPWMHLQNKSVLI